MIKNTQSTFWDSIPSNLRNAIEQTIPAKTLQDRLFLYEKSESLDRRYAQLEYLLKEIINQEHQPKQPSNRQLTPTQDTNHPQASLLFPLAMLQTETKQYDLAEETYRQILITNPSDLAASSNLISVLNFQHKYADAERIAMQILPLLQNHFGASSSQYLGCMRKLMESLVGQGKGGEERKLWKRGMELVATIGDEEVKKEESDAMEELGRKIDSLG
ncbi:hypothetical protein KCU65_g1618, partial [Aureobasidium melanogenum]